MMGALERDYFIFAFAAFEINHVQRLCCDNPIVNRLLNYSAAFYISHFRHLLSKRLVCFKISMMQSYLRGPTWNTNLILCICSFTTFDARFYF